MKRRQYRALTAEHTTPTTARYRRGSGSTANAWQRLPVAWQLALTIAGSATAFAGGYLAVTVAQAAFAGV